LVLHFREQQINWPVAVWAAWLALLGLFGGLYLQFDQGRERPPTQDGRYRLLALGLGGLAGLATFVLGLWLPLGPWAPFSVLEKTTGPDAAPLLEVWKQNWWRIGILGLSVVGGLAAMFISLLPARGVERT